MKRTALKHLRVLSSTWLIGALLTISCLGGRHYRSGEGLTPVYVPSPPPELKTESRPADRMPGHVWIPGYWHWDEADEMWQWIEGSWEIPPYEGVAWQEPQYEDHGDEIWVYRPGYWSTEARLRGTDLPPEKLGAQKSESADNQIPNTEIEDSSAFKSPEEQSETDAKTPPDSKPPQGVDGSKPDTESASPAPDAPEAKSNTDKPQATAVNPKDSPPVAGEAKP